MKNTDKKKAFQVSIDIETHAKIVKHAKGSYRTVRKQLEHDLKELYRNITLTADEKRLFGIVEEGLSNNGGLVANQLMSNTVVGGKFDNNQDDDEEDLL